MPIGSVSHEYHTQTVELPAEACFPEGVEHVNVRVVGKDLVLSSVNLSRDVFLSLRTVFN